MANAYKPALKAAALAGGVGGARLADGLNRALPAGNLAVIVNVGDDFEHLGLRICPDLDTVCYTLARLANPETGWGLREETFTTFEAVKILGGPDWFKLGDRDLATHLERTRRLRQGDRLSTIVADFCKVWGITANVIPASDYPIPTIISTLEGELAFQEYFVHRRCEPIVTGFRFEGVEDSHPAPGVLDTLAGADVLVVCPSNPWVSVDPILAIPGIRGAILSKKNKSPVVAVSPIIAGKTIKGPAAKMFRELGIEPTALAVARHYEGLLSGIVIDQEDQAMRSTIESMGIATMVTDTIMRNEDQRLRLAQETLSFAAGLSGLTEPARVPGAEGQ